MEWPQRWLSDSLTALQVTFEVGAWNRGPKRLFFHRPRGAVSTDDDQQADMLLYIGSSSRGEERDWVDGSRPSQGKIQTQAGCWKIASLRARQRLWQPNLKARWKICCGG